MLLLSVLPVALFALGSAFADTKPSVSILKPLAAALVSGAQVEVEIAYRSNSGEPITQAEVYVDGQVRFGGKIEPTLSGISRFLWDSTLYADGAHSIGAAAVDAGGNAGSVSITLKLANTAIPIPSGPFTVAIISPTEGQEVKGTIDVLIKAQQGADPNWVSYFIDGDFWAARNYAPFAERLDTSQYPDGEHEVSVSAFGPNREKAVASVTVYVNNLGQPLPGLAAKEPAERDPQEEVVAMTPLASVDTASFSSPGEGKTAAPAASESAPTAEAAPAVETALAEPTQAPAEVTMLPSAPEIAPAVPSEAAASPAIAVPAEEVAVAGPAPAAVRAAPASPSPAIVLDAAVPPSRPARRSNGNPTLVYDGQVVAFPDVEAHIYKGTAYVPIRFLIQAKDGKVEWVPPTQQVNATTGDGAKTLGLTIGNKEIVVNGQKVKMPIRAYLLPPGRTIVPLRFIGQILDADVVYNPKTNELLVTSRTAQGTAPAAAPPAG